MLSIILVVTISSTSRIIKERSSPLDQAMHLSLETRNLPSLFLKEMEIISTLLKKNPPRQQK
jgi:hypothetical protein